MNRDINSLIKEFNTEDTEILSAKIHKKYNYYIAPAMLKSQIKEQITKKYESTSKTISQYTFCSGDYVSEWGLPI